MIQLQEPYSPRPIRFMELWQESGWQIKIYGIAYDRELPRAELLDAAKNVARERLAQVPSDMSTYGVGFLGVHDGRGVNFVFLDWWAEENELHHHVYVSPKDRPSAFTYVTPSGLTACVWDLRVMCFERQAWLDSVLKNPHGPNLGMYLESRLNEDA